MISILHVMVICAENKMGFGPVRKYIQEENVKESVKMIPLRLKNIKFNGALFLFKCHMYRFAYILIKLMHMLGINISEKLN